MTYQPEPMTREMIRVMQDWYDGRNSMFFKVSIGETEGKKVKPVTKRQFKLIYNEARKELSEMTDSMAKEHPSDVVALQALVSWATRQSRIIDARTTLRKATVAALEAGMKAENVTRFTQGTVTAWLAPTD